MIKQVLSASAMLVFSMASAITPASAASSLPTVAVSTFSTAGIAPWWGSGFEPGDALADILSDRLVNIGSVSVIDRSHLEQVLREQNLARSGDVTPGSEAKLGRMLGVGYLIVGKVVQFDKSANGGAAGGFGGHMFGGLGGSSTKTTLHVSMKIIETNSGRIVAAVDDEQSSSATSFAVAGAGNASGVGYKSPDFQKSAMGKLLEATADDLAKKIDPSKLVVSAPAPTIAGKILASDEGNYILNIGSDKGVESGMMFSTFEAKVFVDPDTKQSITSEIPKGTIQIISASRGSSIAKSVSGSVRPHQLVKSE